MPISQPPTGKTDMLSTKPGSVGVPVAVSVAIVDQQTLLPLPHGKKGEIAISGKTVLNNYLNHPIANSKSFFHLSLAIDGSNGVKHSQNKYLLTGDLGTMDKEGYIYLNGRSKDIIKKGGEQICLFEIEELLIGHPWIRTVVCFSVPSKLYGEEVGCALVMTSDAPNDLSMREITFEIRTWLKTKKINEFKWPSKWRRVNDHDLPKTKSNKYIRNGLAKVLKLENDRTLKVDRDVINGLRFLLSTKVMFMHIGSEESLGAFANLRNIPWHVHFFFLVGGYSTALTMSPKITTPLKFFMARVRSIYPLYFAALVFGLGNLMVACRPSTFKKTFHWSTLELDESLNSDDSLFCEGAPAIQGSYWGSLVSTILLYLFGLAVTPFWSLSWFLGYYLWFISIYYQCIAIFPFAYNLLYKLRRKKGILLKLFSGLILLSYVFILIPWFQAKNSQTFVIESFDGNEMSTAVFDNDSDSPGSSVDHHNIFVSFDKTPVQAESPYDFLREYNETVNIWIVNYYLFGPFWIIYFVIGMCLAFIYDAYKPAVSIHSRNWGIVADVCTGCMIIIAALIVGQGRLDDESDVWFLRPSEADSLHLDNLLVVRLWDAISGRLFCPLTALWLFALSTGEGVTAKLFRNRFVNKYLSPNTYGCFLFHQMVSQWYYAIVYGRWWNYWSDRKAFYWFSPHPCPVKIYEIPIVMGLTIAFSGMMNTLVMPIMNELFHNAKSFISRKHNIVIGQNDVELTVSKIIEDVTGIRPHLDWTLEECGIASIGLAVLATSLNKSLSLSKPKSILSDDLISAKSVADLVDLINARGGSALSSTSHSGEV